MLEAMLEKCCPVSKETDAVVNEIPNSIELKIVAEHLSWKALKPCVKKYYEFQKVLEGMGKVKRIFRQGRLHKKQQRRFHQKYQRRFR